MARRLRWILPGVAVHLIQRGVNRSACFRSDSDYLVYLSHLRELCQRYGCAVHAYCLMTNHVHLLLTPQDTSSCTRLMRDLGRRYVPYFNRRHQRTGTLWEGRFRSCLVESARYLLACYRYIELNPVRARMVGHPSAYLWSSHAVNSGSRADSFVSAHADYDALGGHPECRHAAYRALFDQALDEALLNAIRDATNGGYPLASDSFMESRLKPLGWKKGRDKPGPRSTLAQGPNAVTNRDPDPELGLVTSR